VDSGATPANVPTALDGQLIVGSDTSIPEFRALLDNAEEYPTISIGIIEFVRMPPVSGAPEGSREA
jgi:hypothetical protein